MKRNQLRGSASTAAVHARDRDALKRSIWLSIATAIVRRREPALMTEADRG